MHVDLLRVRLDQAIQATVVLELTGVEDAPGVKEGGVLEQVTRELTIEALPDRHPGLDPARRVGAADRRHDHARGDHARRVASRWSTTRDGYRHGHTAAPPARGRDEIEAETELVGEGEADAEGEEGDGEAAEGGSAATATSAE